MKVNKNLIITAVITLIAGIGISAIVFKPMGTVATEKNNAELYFEMKEQAKAEAQAEFEKQLEDVKKETSQEIANLKAEYDKAIADAKLQQANEIQAAIQQAQLETQSKIEQATSWQAIEEKRQEEVKKDPNYSEEPPTGTTGQGKEQEGIKITN